MGLSLLPKIAASQDSNNVYVVWVDNSPGKNYDILFKQSTDGGATFGDTINLSDNEGLSFFPRILAIPGSNNVYVVWVDKSSEDNYDILFKRSTDGGATFGDTINLSDNEGLSLLPQIYTSGSFRVYIIWVDKSSEDNYDILFKRSTLMVELSS